MRRTSDGHWWGEAPFEPRINGTGNTVQECKNKVMETVDCLNAFNVEFDFNGEPLSNPIIWLYDIWSLLEYAFKNLWH